MSNPSKAKGTAGETRVLRWLIANGYPQASRKVLAGSKDQGDLQVMPRGIAEVKNPKDWTAHDLAGWVQETLVEVQNSDSAWGILVVLKYRGHVASALTIELSWTGAISYVGPLDGWRADADR